MAHKLILEVKDSTVNNKFLYVEDLSIWDEMLPVSYRTFQVLPPFGGSYITVPFPTNGNLAITSLQLGLSTGLEDLPDGMYRLHYSVAPNSKVFLEIGHYRVAKLMNMVLARMSEIETTPESIDDCGNVTITKLEDSLLHIWMLLTGAQRISRDIMMSSKADELYKKAMREYDKLFVETCNGC